MNNQQARVLVVDDEDNLRFLVESALQVQGYETAGADSADAALTLVQRFAPDLIVLDVMLPDTDGFGVLRRIREAGLRAPVIFLTARDGTDDRVRGLSTGGDDYVTKPFAIAELLARVDLRLNDAHGVASRNLRIADLEIDADAHRVTRAGELISLTPTEYKLLHYLMVNAGRVVSRAQILDHVWSYDFDGESSIVDTYVSYLRRKVDHLEPGLIHTVRGVGFCLRAEP